MVIKALNIHQIYIFKYIWKSNILINFIGCICTCFIYVIYISVPIVFMISWVILDPSFLR